MKDTITYEMVNAVQQVCKHADFDGEKYTLNIFDYDRNGIVPCSLTQALFPMIIDLALEHLKRKTSTSLVEWITSVPKTNNIEYKNKEFVLKNKTLPVFDWGIVK